MTNLRSQLQAIYDSRGALTPRLVVQEARPEDHPLHDRFEWDDSIAGERYREHQAHELIQLVRVVYRPASNDGPERSVRQFHAVKGDAGWNYVPVETVVADPVLTEIVKRDMQREWQQLVARYECFEEFFEMVRKDLDAA